MMKTKKMLFIYNEPPLQTSGGNIRVCQLIKAAAKENEVTLLILPKRRKDEDIERIKK